MSIQKILEMAETFVALADEDNKTPHNEEYQEQRNRLSQFYDHFQKQLRIIVNEMDGDLFTLRHRGFDPKMFKLFSTVYQNVLDLFKSIQEDKPYRAAEKVISYVTNRPTRIVLENLNFLAKHHVQATNVDFAPNKTLQHPQIRSIDALNKLALELKEYMAQNPLIVPPGQARSEVPTEPPPRDKAVFGPESKLGPEDKTKA